LSFAIGCLLARRPSGSAPPEILGPLVILTQRNSLDLPARARGSRSPSGDPAAGRRLLAQSEDELLHIHRQRRAEREIGPGARVPEAEAGGVERLPRERAERRRGPDAPAPVERIS